MQRVRIDATGGLMMSERRVGAHVMRIEDDGLVRVDFHGLIQKHEMEEILGEHDAKLAAEGDLYVMSDLRDATSMEPGARRAAAQAA